jgi:hypothetical protein
MIKYLKNGLFILTFLAIPLLSVTEVSAAPKKPCVSCNKNKAKPKLKAKSKIKAKSKLKAKSKKTSQESLKRNQVKNRANNLTAAGHPKKKIKEFER